MRLTSLRRAIHGLIVGPPGSGKGTVSARIVRDFDMKHLSCGDMLRAEISKKTAYGLRAMTYTVSGKLVPDDLVVDLMLSQLQRIPLATNWLLDGFPRNVAQAQHLVEQERLHAVINLDVPFLTIQNRLCGRWTHLPSGRVYNDGFNPPRIAGRDDVTGEALVQRDDDKPETVLKRLETYVDQTRPLLEFFRDMDILHSYSGTKTDDIWPSIRQFMGKLIEDDSRRIEEKAL